MNELEKLRKQIDEVDLQIVEAFEKRIAIAKKVAEYKVENGLAVLDSGREKQVLEKRVGMLINPAYEMDVRRLFELLMSISRGAQQKIVREDEKTAHIETARCVAFQGVRGAYSQQALFEVFGQDAKAKAYISFEDVFSAVRDGSAEYGVLPIENSFTGSVLPVYDLLADGGVYITGEHRLKINHSLFGVAGAKLPDVREVYSHEQALSQCAGYFAGRDIRLIPYYNTAAAAKHIAELGDKTKAAIASCYAGEVYGLKMLAENINTSSENTTRFIVISRKMAEDGNANKATVRFVLTHKPGSLAHALDVFSKYGLNMTKIESRPLPGRNFEYAFYVDFEGEHIAGDVGRAVGDAAGDIAEARILGIYIGGKE